MIIKKATIEQLLRVYEDVEALLRTLKQKESQMLGAHSIDVKKLIDQLARSKKRLERKIGNTLLLEKHNIKRKLKGLASDFSGRR
ncbi:MAG: hypothetical protein H6617_11140 [Bdellovibrionaceae bacterium]|nr:hypothetical protein [Pseudobdellovibrionaceae bacterium]